MQERISNKESPIQSQRNKALFERRLKDRRMEKGKGYTYVSTVGWICRREKCRRSNKDNFQ
jgi:hypothetical protein